MAAQSQRCLFTLMHAQRENHEEIVRDLVAPVTREVRNHPHLDSLFFARYNQPHWQVRFRVLGKPEWVEGPVKELVQRHLGPLQSRGLLEGYEFAEYQREYDRYGGEEGMALAEKIFLHDTVACLELMEAERRGGLEKSRREFSMVLTDRFLDLLRFDPERRLAFYRYGYQWALETKSWTDEDLQVLDGRYQSLKPGLIDLFQGGPAADPVLAYGGEAPSRIAREFLEAVRPAVEQLLAAHAAGRIPQDLVYLAWSYTHMHCNRLGIDPAPEAILRYFMHRLLQDGAASPP